MSMGDWRCLFGAATVFVFLVVTLLPASFALFPNPNVFEGLPLFTEQKSRPLDGFGGSFRTLP